MVTLEHFLLVLKFLVEIIIPDEPTSVREAIVIREYIENEVRSFYNFAVEEVYLRKNRFSWKFLLPRERVRRKSPTRPFSSESISQNNVTLERHSDGGDRTYVSNHAKTHQYLYKATVANLHFSQIIHFKIL